MDKNWITLYPDTFIWIKNQDGYIYNSLNHKGFSFDLHEGVFECCQKLLDPESLYTANVPENIEVSKTLRDWVERITVECGAGYVTPSSAQKPVSFKPMLKILHGMDYHIWEHQRGFGGNIMQNLHELTFYLNHSIYGDDFLYKQIIFPQKDCGQLNRERIVSFISNGKNPFLSNINLVGNIFAYDQFEQLINDIAEMEMSCTIKITIQDLTDNLKVLKRFEWPENIQFDILVRSIPEQPYLLLQELKAPVSVTLLVSTTEDYQLFFDEFSDIAVYQDARVVPIFKGDNIKFFVDNVFIERKDLEEVKISKRNILMNQVLNSNHFGKLMVFSDGTVYANVNKKPIGTIGNSVYASVYKEMTEGESWLRIRDMKPCCDCVFQWLCPSPSNYELAIGKPNLCHVKP